MTQPDDGRRGHGVPGFSAQESLRAQLLSDALGNCLPLTHVTSVMSHEDLAASLRVQQDLALRTIRSLLDDRLVQIGDISGASDERIVPWDLSIDDTMDRIYDLFVNHYDEPALWEFTIWLGLTPAGERLAHQLRNPARD